MTTLRLVLHLVVYLFLIVLLGRLVLEWIQSLARQWHPRGPVLLLAEAVYTITDPPLKLLRRFIPPLKLGQVQLDMGFLVLLLAVYLLLFLLG